MRSGRKRKLRSEYLRWAQASTSTDRLLLQRHRLTELIVAGLIRQNQSAGLTVRHRYEYIESSLKAHYLSARELCINTVYAKLRTGETLRAIYVREILDRPTVNAILYKSPNRIEIDYKLASIQSKFLKCQNLQPQNIIRERWGQYFEVYLEGISEIDALNEEIAGFLEKIEKYRDDKRRLWLAVGALAFAITFQAVWPSIKQLPWDQWSSSIRAVWVLASQRNAGLPSAADSSAPPAP